MRKILYSITIISIILITASAFAICKVHTEIKKSRDEIERIRHELEESRRWREQVQEWLDKLKIEPDMTVSYYAPLDPTAKKGMCHNGDPFHTAIGSRPGPGTMAVDPARIPLGSRMMLLYDDGTVEVGRAEDVGGKIKGARVDVFRHTVTAARSEGLRKAVVVHYR